jgi:hypothetical protein
MDIYAMVDGELVLMRSVTKHCYICLRETTFYAEQNAKQYGGIVCGSVNCMEKRNDNHLEQGIDLSQ